ncbi:SMP-30/gluconolactonase/LRE family protein [Paenibacillus xanthanilyticus]|uniref:SMP-30/gluconolactonase/LRE family protein n=1 Tax=Paenibacillus xanthanilyticus TaxID=1783531 RepID=A0ABV8KDY1_9BACL
MRRKVIPVLAATMVAVAVMAPAMQASEGTKRAASVSIAVDLDPNSATGMRVEGITGDKQGRLYTIDMDSKRLFRFTPATGQLETLTVLPRSATGMAFDEQGNLYMASGGGSGVDGVILRISADALVSGPVESGKVETFAQDVDGANGLAFDRDGNLYVSGGATGNIYVITPQGERTVWASGIAAERPEQPITVNGLAFGRDGRLYMANTSAGEINRVRIKKDGTFGDVERFAKDPLLYGADGIAFGPDGDLYVAANERNAIVKVSRSGKVKEVAANDSRGPLEFPASLHVVGDTMYVSNFDVARGVNAPNQPGIGASIAKIELEKKHRGHHHKR